MMTPAKTSPDKDKEDMQQLFDGLDVAQNETLQRIMSQKGESEGRRQKKWELKRWDKMHTEQIKEGSSQVNESSMGKRK